MTTDRQVGFFHQFLQVLDGDAAEGGEGAAVFQVLFQPAAERMGTGFGVEEPPGFALFGVVAVVEVGQEVFDGAGLGQLGVACVQHSGAAIGFLVDQVDDAMTDRHGILG
ncbi:hypothetical protein D3C84_801360 [compost metagenome]